MVLYYKLYKLIGGKVMKKILIVSLDVIEDLEGESKKELIGSLKNIAEDGNIICFISHDYRRLRTVQKLYGDISSNFKFKTRREIREKIEPNKSNYFMVLGNVDQDLILAANKKLLFLCPTWVKCIEDKAKKYGIPIKTSEQLVHIIKTVNNQNVWYASYKLDNQTTIISLMDGAYGYYAKSSEERQMIKNFEDVLKKGKKTSYFEILQYHFLAAISNDNNIFNDVSTWCIFPSSSTTLSPMMMEFKERVRYMRSSREPSNTIQNNLFIRHSAVEKSHEQGSEIREAKAAGLHFGSIMLDPAYSNKIKNKTVCIFDDYLNYGNSFEACRHLLLKAGVKNMVFVTFGKFRKPYLHQHWGISGDVFSDTYTATNKIIVKRIQHREFEIDEAAKVEVENLHRIFNL